MPDRTIAGMDSPPAAVPGAEAAPARLPALLSDLSGDVRALLRQRSSLLALAGAAGAVAFTYAVLWVVTRATEGKPDVDPDLARLRLSLLLPDTLPYVLLLAQSFGGIAVAGAVAFAAADIGAGRDAGPRVRRLAACLLLTPLVVAAALATGLVLATLFALREGGLDLSFLDARYPFDLLLGFLRTSFVLLPVAGAALAVAAITGRALRGWVAGVALAIGGPIVAALAFDGGVSLVADALPARHAEAIMRLNGVVPAFEPAAPPDLPSVPMAVVVTFAYTLVLAAVALPFLGRRAQGSCTIEDEAAGQDAGKRGSTMRKKTVRDIDVAGKRVLVRVDFNVPLDDQRRVTDDTRIRAAVPTIEYLCAEGARVILCSHLGRPKPGEHSNVPGLQQPDPLSLRPVAARLEELLGAPVAFAADCVGPAAEQAVAALGPGDVLLLENLRFHAEEEANDTEFARRLAGLADVYVNDAFGTAHRAHASTAGVAVFLPAVAGLLLEREVDYLTRVVEAPEHPFAVILGGAKITDKIGVIENMLGKADRLLIGGGMANTFFAAEGKSIGDSLFEANASDLARRLLESARTHGTEVLLPVDVAIGDRFDAQANRQVVDVDAVPAGWRILDIGPRTVELFAGKIQDCRTVAWNGPMGVFEFPAFAEGTLGLARAVAAVNGTTVVGGGETVAAVEQSGVADRISHISTGGGASLEFLEGKVLPGIAALNDLDAPE